LTGFALAAGFTSQWVYGLTVTWRPLAWQLGVAIGESMAGSKLPRSVVGVEFTEGQAFGGGVAVSSLICADTPTWPYLPHSLLLILLKLYS